MDDDLKKQMRKLAMTKQLNFLIGSGCSMPTIPSMSDECFRNSEGKDKEWEELSKDEKTNIASNLSKKVKEVSKQILNDDTSVANTQKQYNEFLQAIVEVLNLSNSRQTPKNANIFSTNYDLFIEKAADKVLQNNRLVFNDGAGGYFERYLNSSNYNRLVAYKGLSDNYISEIPSISLIKPHGSMNWEKDGENIKILLQVSDTPVVVPPTGLESKETFLQNHFYEMLRIFETELDKQQSVLFVVGFSFQDVHIKKMISRAVQNPELMIFIFCYDENDKEKISRNLFSGGKRKNIHFLVPEIDEENFTLSNLTEVLNGTSEKDLKDETE